MWPVGKGLATLGLYIDWFFCKCWFSKIFPENKGGKRHAYLNLETLFFCPLKFQAGFFSHFQNMLKLSAIEVYVPGELSSFREAFYIYLNALAILLCMFQGDELVCAEVV